MSESTFVMIKPDGVSLGLCGEIIRRFEVRGLRLSAMKMFRPPTSLVAEHYEHLQSEPVFSDLLTYISSSESPVICMCWQGPQAVELCRLLIGSKDPESAGPGTIRGDFSVVSGWNLIHGSDSRESAAKEIKLWFSKEDDNQQIDKQQRPEIRQLFRQVYFTTNARRQLTPVNTSTLVMSDSLTSSTNSSPKLVGQSKTMEYNTKCVSENTCTVTAVAAKNKITDVEISIIVSPVDNDVGSQGQTTTRRSRSRSVSKSRSATKLPEITVDPSLSSLNTMQKSRTRSRSPAGNNSNIGKVAHNRFHHNCCDKKGPSFDDVRAQSQLNATKYRLSKYANYQNLNNSSNAVVAYDSTNNYQKKPFMRMNGGVLNQNGVRKTASATRESSSSSTSTAIVVVNEMTGDEEIGSKPSQISVFLDSNPEFLENYVMSNINLETLERWTIRKARRPNQTEPSSGKPSRAPSLSKWKFCVHADKRAMLQEMTSHIKTCQNAAVSRGNILFELGRCIAGAIDADTFNLYVVDGQDLLKFEVKSPTGDLNDDGLEEQERIPEYQPIGSGGTLAAFCAEVAENIRQQVPTDDPRFPDGINNLQGNYQVLLTPVVNSDNGEVFAVMEFLREGVEAPFYEEDEEIVNSYLVWGEVAIHYADLYGSVRRQKDLDGFLLNLVRSIFMEMVSMDALITKIMNFAQKLVDADRASLFLVDSKTNQLFARIFDIQGKSTDGFEEKDLAKEIRFPVGTGIAGFVAETGETLNVRDAYTDPRFNSAIDEQTGYTTKSILCMPICIRGLVIGVVQMVNKINGYFTREDEEAFEVFAVYCGLALHHAKLYDKIRRSEQKYKVALEVLSYHNASTMNEVDDIVAEGPPPDDVEISRFTFYALNVDDMVKVRKALYMFVDLFGLERFDYETLVRFTITVKKNYRQVAYHNWAHGFHVANSIYSILKASPNIFRPLECLAMFVGAICHDLDHRGFNNKFMIDIGSPLAAIYSTSTMEHHHFNMTVTILQQENHNIFAKLNPDEYRQVLGNVKHCILATDLALFFPNKARLLNILKEGAFSWDLPDHRLLVEALMMTGSDLCANSKPWDLQMQTVNVIYEEFYKQGDYELEIGRTPAPIMNRKYDDQQAIHQGDVEKDLGWKPIPLFDRDHCDDIASMQVGFIGGICMPCYDLLVQVLPATSPMQQQCQQNLEMWKEKAEQRKRELENERLAFHEQQEKAEAEEAAKEADQVIDEEDGEVEVIEDVGDPEKVEVEDGDED